MGSKISNDKAMLPDHSLINPYPGLRPYQFGDVATFFGRERSLDLMVDVLASVHLLAVLGSSGCGKSSLVNCGLIPALLRGAMTTSGTVFKIAHFRPGKAPVQSMATTLAQPGLLFRADEQQTLTPKEIIESTLRLGDGGLSDVYRQAYPDCNTNLLVIVDQFEELFRFQSTAGEEKEVVAYREESEAFVNMLLDASRQRQCPIYVVLTMRSDFLGECANLPVLADALNSSQYLVPRMNRQERRKAIAGPARVAGTALDDVLTTRLVNDVGDDPDQLSILAHALNRTFQVWQADGGVGKIGMAHYERIGTMRDALNQHADDAFGKLSGAKKQIAERVFKALTDRVDDSRGVRRPHSLARLGEIVGEPPAAVLSALEVFRADSQSFLMPPLKESVTAETILDISHESLMRKWNLLKGWCSEEVMSARLFRQLYKDAVLHREKKRSLWRDPELSQALSWQKLNRPTAGWASLYGGELSLAQQFLAMSTRSKRIRRGLIAAVVFALCAAFLAMAGMSVWTASREEKRYWADQKIANLNAENARYRMTTAKRKIENAKTEIEIAEAERKAADLKRRRFEEQKRQFNEMTKENPALEQRIERLLENIHHLRIDILVQQALNAESKYLISVFKGESIYLAGRAKMLSDAIGAIQSEIDGLSKINAELLAELKPLIAANQSARETLEKLRTVNQTLRESLLRNGFRRIPMAVSVEHTASAGMAGHNTAANPKSAIRMLEFDKARFKATQAKNKMLRLLIEEYEKEKSLLAVEKKQSEDIGATLQENVGLADTARHHAKKIAVGRFNALTEATLEANQLRHRQVSTRVDIRRAHAIAIEVAAEADAVRRDNDRLQRKLDELAQNESQ